MIEIGYYNTLEVLRYTEHGAYLNGLDLGEILMPKKYVKENHIIGSSVEIFLYKDSEDRLVASTDKPYATVGQFANLKVKQVNTIGAFLDWGLEKDLLLPFSEQERKVGVDDKCVVYVCLDYESERIIASAKISKHLSHNPTGFIEGEEADILIYGQTDLGYKVIVNNAFSGLIYANEIFEPIQIGESRKAYIKKVREDGKIDVALQPDGFKKIDSLENTILDRLKQANGFIAVSDKSTPEYIASLFGVSKKTYKKAVGALYKKRMIEITPDGLKLK